MSNVNEANRAATKESDHSSIRCCFKKSIVLLRCLLLLSSASSTVFGARADCDDQREQFPRGTSAAQSAVAANRSNRPATVADSIEMTRLGDVKYTDGWPSQGMVAKFSPDGKRFVVILKKGNLENNTNEYSLALFQTTEVFHSPEPQVIVRMASSSNRPAIDNVVWLDDNNTILFLGARPGEPAQPYSLKCASRELTKLTSNARIITSFVAAGSGEVVVYAARDPAVSFLTESAARQGIVVANEGVADLIQGSHGGSDLDDHSLFIKRLGQEGETKIAIHGRIMDDHPEMSLSPDGAHLLVETEVASVPSTWGEYEDQFLKTITLHPPTNGARTLINQYELIDTVTGASQVLFDAPLPTSGSEMAWSPDSQSAVLSDVYLPLTVDDPAERALRKSHPFLVEIKTSSGQFVKLSDEDLRLINWDPKTGHITCDVGRIDSLNGKATPKAYFRKNGETWSQASTPEQTGVMSLPDIILDEDLNTPPRIVALNPSTGRKSILMDLNPRFRNLALAKVEEVTWKDSRGNLVKGGLYWPPNYEARKRYPLVIQTHGWLTNRFWMDGPFPTAFAAQALAGKGFFVLQASDPDWHIVVTAKEAPSAMAAYEGAVRYLDGKGLIDPDRVGITGFSRTYWYVTYTLTHSKYRFAAAAVADGVDYSYFQYMALSNALPSMAGEFEQVFGGAPYGKRLLEWLKQSPAYLMDRIETPLRIQALGPDSLLLDWHWYSGLTRLGKPVEMIYIPEGTHVLEKPWERMTSQQGNVDWFCFWLKGEEDPDPAKAEQYKHWRALQRRTASLVGTR